MKSNEVQKKVALVIESESKSNNLWGRIEYNNDLIIDVARTIDELQVKMRAHLHERYHFKPEELEFEVLYDLTALFKEKNFLNLSAIAERAGINRSIMAQYAAGIKFPSMERASKIQEVIHGIGNELRSVSLAVKMRPVYANSGERCIEDDLIERQGVIEWMEKYIIEEKDAPKHMFDSFKQAFTSEFFEEQPASGSFNGTAIGAIKSKKPTNKVQKIAKQIT